MFEHWIQAELTEFPQIVHLSGDGFSQDDGGNLVGVRVTAGGAPATLSGTVKANIIRGDGSTIEATGSIQNTNEAYVELPVSAYTVLGHIGVYLRIETSSQTITLGGIETYVTPSQVGTLIS